ncbi:hypothetical protein VARIO8X_60167 [Burkholderiales bacterium 8X]|nr:hypothetical protein VARIO8X_60167 [Burkholderiales bacterium 8X]
MENAKDAQSPADTGQIEDLAAERLAKEVVDGAQAMWRAAKAEKIGSKKKAPPVIGGSRLKQVYEVVGNHLVAVFINDDERKVRVSLEAGDAALVIYDSDITSLIVIRWEGDLPATLIKHMVDPCFTIIEQSSARFLENEGPSAKRSPVQVQILAPDPDGQVPRALVKAVVQARNTTRTPIIDFTSGLVPGAYSPTTISSLSEVGLGCRDGQFAIEDLSKTGASSPQFERQTLKLDLKLLNTIPDPQKFHYSDMMQIGPTDSKRPDRSKVILAPGSIYTVDLVATECYYKNLWAHIVLLSFDHTSQQIVVMQLHAEELIKQLRSTELTPAHEQLFVELSQLQTPYVSRQRSVMVIHHEKLSTHQIESRAALQWTESFDDNFNRFKAKHAKHFVIEGARKFQELSAPKTFEYPSSYGECLRLSLVKNSVKVEFLKSMPQGIMALGSLDWNVDHRLMRSVKFGESPAPARS